MRVHYEILNQKGTPAFYSDTYTNRPTYGFAGRVFISTDTGQIFEDTGSAWSLIADAGVGGGTLASVTANGNSTATGIVITANGLSSNSITNTGNTLGSVLFAGTGGLESQSNATFFWDNTNKRLGIGNASPGAPLDIHGTGTQLQLNGTGSSNSYIQFQNAGVSKWRIGNTYSAGANSYGIYNNGLSSLALTINSTNNGIITTGYLNIENGLGTNQIYLTKSSGDVYGTIQTEAGGNKFSLGNVSNIGTLGTPNITWTSGSQVGINNSSPSYELDVTGTFRTTGRSLLTGNVGIGAATTSTTLYVYSSTNTVELRLERGGAGDVGARWKRNGSDIGYISNADWILPSTSSTDFAVNAVNNLLFGTFSNERMRIVNNGNICMATTTDFGYKLNLNGQPGCNGYTAWTNWSDIRLKENVTNFDSTNVLERISKIRPVTYNYNELSGFDEETRNRRISGFIAQELKEVFPDMVGTIKKDNIEYYDTNLSNLDLYLVKAIQEIYEKLLKNNIN
jgi:hypothetical protein